MKTKKVFSLLLAITIMSFFAGGCGPQATPESDAATLPDATTAPATEVPAEEKAPILLWSEVNVASPQTEMDKEFVVVVPGLEDTTGRKLDNLTVPYDQLDNNVNLAVQASGEVPDVFEMQTSRLGFHFGNGTLQDLTDFVKSASWFGQLTKAGLASCTAPDGKIYCVPLDSQSRLVYYYTDAFPDGIPATTDELLEMAPTLKEKNLFSITGKFSEVQGIEVSWFSLIKSYGGDFADDEGKVNWASEETVKAIEFAREMVAKGYIPEVALAPGFEGEVSFMNGTAAAFNAGSWSYVWLNPLQTPDGDKFDKGSFSTQAAMEDNELKIAPPISAPGGKPVSLITGHGWAIPVGAKNVDAAYDFINYMMLPEPNAQIAYAYGGLPTVNDAFLDARYADSLYWQAVIEMFETYAVPMDPIVDYDKVLLKMSDTVIKLVQNPNLDIMQELQKVQNELNN